MITVGVDEVGRGCWAGPVVAGAVILSQPIDGLKDSKKLSKQQRETLALLIHEHAAAVGIGWVSAAEIDDIGLSAAVAKAMRLAVEQLDAQFDEIIIDGATNFLPDNPKAKTLVKADDLIPAASAASIVAKVARDQYMAALPEVYAKYVFAQHVGYGTALHIERLKLHGVSDLHRKSYKPIRQFLLELPA